MGENMNELKDQESNWVTHPKLGPLQVTQRSDGMGILLLHRADRIKQFLLLLLRPVREIKTEHIRSSEEELLEHLSALRGRAEGSKLLG